MLREHSKTLNLEMDEITKKLKMHQEQVIQLEQYSRRENLKFMNIPETEDNNIKSEDLIYNILQDDLGIDTTNIRFHAVHRVGKQYKERSRPIIVRFVCRQDGDLVFRWKKKLQQSRHYKDAYITQDYAKAFQEERKLLIKAMHKAKDAGQQAKVIDRNLWIGDSKFTVANIPGDNQPL